MDFRLGSLLESIQERSAQMPSTPDTTKAIPCYVTSTFDWRRAFIEGAREARGPKGPFGPFGGIGVALRAALGFSAGLRSLQAGFGLGRPGFTVSVVKPRSPAFHETSWANQP